MRLRASIVTYLISSRMKSTRRFKRADRLHSLVTGAFLSSPAILKIADLILQKHIHYIHYIQKRAVEPVRA